MISPQRFTIAALLATLVVLPARAQQQQQQQQQTVPPPKPFPGATPTTSKPSDPATPTTTPNAPTGPAGPARSGCDAASLGAPVYPGAEYVEAFDAGKGQRFCLFGTDATYAEIVEYYRRTVKSSNREIFRSPGVWQFDLGRYSEETMAYPPGILVKDYAWNGSAGYLVLRGPQEKRYRTIIQIVPPSGPVR